MEPDEDDDPYIMIKDVAGGVQTAQERYRPNIEIHSSDDQVIHNEDYEKSNKFDSF